MEKLKLIMFNVIKSQDEYWSEDVIFNIKIENGGVEIVNIKNIFDNSIPIEIISLKLLHNLNVLYEFYIDNTPKSKSVSKGIDKEKATSFKLTVVNNEYVLLDKNKLSIFDENEFSAILLEIYNSLKTFISKKSTTVRYKELKRLDDFNKITKSFDSNLENFIKNNMDFYESYLEKYYNGYCKASFVLGLSSILLSFTFLVPLLAIIFGIIGAVQIDDSIEKGFWMGMTGLILGILYLFTAIYHLY